MLKAITWCAKCLFLYFLVMIIAVRYSWVLATPVWQIARKMNWTQLNQLYYTLSYALPIFAVAGFLFGLLPFGKLGMALNELAATMSPNTFRRLKPEPERVAPVLWAWLPVTVAFLVRFVSWQSKNSSVLDPGRSTGRVERFFGTIHGQTNNLVDSRWISDRFLFTVPMGFLMACALAALLRYRFLTKRPNTVDSTEPEA